MSVKSHLKLACKTPQLGFAYLFLIGIAAFILGVNMYFHYGIEQFIVVFFVVSHLLFNHFTALVGLAKNHSALAAFSLHDVVLVLVGVCILIKDVMSQALKQQLSLYVFILVIWLVTIMLNPKVRTKKFFTHTFVVLLMLTSVSALIALFRML